MNDLTPRQQDTLARGLAAFDAASRLRRFRRGALRGAALAASLALAVFLADRLSGSSAQGLPACVEIIASDLQLASELEMANACERVNRTDGRLCVVECVPARQ
jgi:hypothetical protein